MSRSCEVDSSRISASLKDSNTLVANGWTPTSKFVPLLFTMLCRLPGALHTCLAFSALFFLAAVRDSRLVLRYVGRVPVLNYHVWVLILIVIKLVTVEQTFHYLRL